MDRITLLFSGVALGTALVVAGAVMQSGCAAEESCEYLMNCEPYEYQERQYFWVYKETDPKNPSICPDGAMGYTYFMNRDSADMGKCQLMGQEYGGCPLPILLVWETSACSGMNKPIPATGLHAGCNNAMAGAPNSIENITEKNAGIITQNPQHKDAWCHCESAPIPPQQLTLCPEAAGDVPADAVQCFIATSEETCPSPYSVAWEAYRTYTDSRNCSDCTCTIDACKGGGIQYFDSTTCNPSDGGTPLAKCLGKPTFQFDGSHGSLYITPATAQINPSKTKPGAVAIGGAITPYEPITLCCRAK